MKIVVTILAFCLSLVTFAQSNYQVDYENPSGWSSIVFDQSLNNLGEQYVVFSTHSGAHWQSIISKFAAGGETIWSREFYKNQLGDVAFEHCFGASDGGVIILGSVDKDKLVFKLDKTGSDVWSTRIPSSSDITMSSITEDSEGNFYVSGGRVCEGGLSHC